MEIKQIENKNQLFSFFKTNFCLFSYHIGDLDDFFFKDCAYYGLIDESTNKILEVCLVYKGLSTPTILALGLTPNFLTLLQDLSEVLPDRFFCHYLPEYEKFFASKYTMTELGLHQKMYLKNYQKVKIKGIENIKALNLEHKKQLDEFYKEAYPNTYFEPYMLKTGYYYGLQEQNRIISVVGVHTYSKEYSLAVLGNIATHPEFRGKGYGFTLISYLLSKMVENLDFISLNVKKDNSNAIKLYTKLGFEYCNDYKEAYFEKKNLS